ncbi:MAG: helix-turn-helix domain-containing protein [Stellaceae bacterium]
MSIFHGAAIGGSHSTRRATQLSARLFGSSREAAAARQHDDPQALIRAALRRRRRTLGLTQEGAAQLLGMKRLSYHRIETGVRRIRFADLAALCELYQCEPVELLQDSRLAAAYANATGTIAPRQAAANPSALRK